MLLKLIENIRYPTAICILAGLASLFYLHKLTSTERLIIVVIFMSIAADLFANYIALKGKYNGDVYNIICPIEKITIVVCYHLNSYKSQFRLLYVTGIITFILLSICGYSLNDHPGYIHTEVYVISGFIVAVLSYLQLRNILLEKAKDSIPIFWFSMANLVYYTLMISVISARPVALSISWDFNTQINIVNDIAYSLWSPIILIGIIWNRTKI